MAKTQLCILQIQELAAKYADRHCVVVEDYNVMMRYLMALVVFSHFQRPGVATNMTVTEYLHAKEEDGHHVISVAEHKTDTSGLAKVALEPADYKLFRLFFKW